MVRRAVVMASVLGAVSAAGALAFSRELTMAGRALVTSAPRTGRAFTPVPRPFDTHSSIGGRFVSASDSLQGRYCRFPPSGPETHQNAEDTDLPGLDSLGLRKLQGQSSVSSAPDTAAML